MKDDVEAVIEFLLDKNFDIHPFFEQEIILNGERLVVFGRVYFDPPNGELQHNLSLKQRIILNCIYLRHHDGFVRQRHLEQLLNEVEFFVIPFVFQLLGEYVIEILPFVDKHINEKTMPFYLQFIQENKKYWQQTESRMISYWNAYYRNIKLTDYIGARIVSRIKEAKNNQRLNNPHL